jgi:hypothetical protein
MITTRVYSMFPNTLNQEVKSDTAINGRVLINEFSRLIDICDLKDQKIKVMYGQKKNDSLLVLSLNNRIFLQQYEYNVVIMKERETNQTLSDKLSRNSIEMDQTLRKSRRIIIGESIAIFILTSILLIK